MTEKWSGMRGIAPVPTYVVMQPTTLCNLDCSYCYLPFRAADNRMPVGVAAAVAESVSPFARAGRFSVVWHGGEPLLRAENDHQDEDDDQRSNDGDSPEAGDRARVGLSIVDRINQADT